mgnify:FL=1
MVKRITLQNGIKVILEYMPILDTVSTGFFFITGSANETKETNGYTHFIEHMLFKGTDKISAKELVRKIEGVGGVFNAFTSRHLTSFYINIISKYFERAIDTLEDIILNSAFREEDIAKEKKVVIEEIKMVNDTPEETASSQFFAEAYKGTAMAFPIGGNINNIKTINREKVYKYFKKNFNANNLVVSIAGKFDMDLAIKKLSNIKLKKNIKTENKEIPFFYKTTSKEREDLNHVYFSLYAPSYKASDDKKYSMNILNDIFGVSSYSRLYQSVRENKGLCYNIYSSATSFINGGLFEITGSTSLKNYEETIATIYGEINKIINERITKEELEESKESYKSYMAFSKLNANYIMNKNARNEIYASKYMSFKDIYKSIDKVNINSVNEVIDEKLSDKKFFLTSVGPKGSKDISKNISKKLNLN